MQLLSIFVLILNLCIIVYMWKNLNQDQQNFVDILEADGKHSCATVKLYNRWLHFGINALLTTVLGASNNCAQLLVAPTRMEIQKAHSNRSWLDIGIQSSRNLGSTDMERRLLRILLMLSSGFLQLMYVLPKLEPEAGSITFPCL
jgi:hypothetical protein